MKEKIEELIAQVKLRRDEIFHELNELSQIDISKFSDADTKDIKQSIYNLEGEYQIRRDFISDLEYLV
jgi:hypothetical protein